MNVDDLVAVIKSKPPKRITVMVTLPVEHEPHLLHAVDQVLTALTNAGITADSVAAFHGDEGAP